MYRYIKNILFLVLLFWVEKVKKNTSCVWRLTHSTAQPAIVTTIKGLPDKNSKGTNRDS